MPLWLVKPNELADPPVLVAAIDPMNEHDKPAALDDEILPDSANSLPIMSAGTCTRSIPTTRVLQLPRLPPTPTSRYHCRSTRSSSRCTKTIRNDSVRSRRSTGSTPTVAHLVAGLTHEELPIVADDSSKASVVVMGAVAIPKPLEATLHRRNRGAHTRAPALRSADRQAGLVPDAGRAARARSRLRSGDSLLNCWRAARRHANH